MALGLMALVLFLASVAQRQNTLEHAEYNLKQFVVAASLMSSALDADQSRPPRASSQRRCAWRPSAPQTGMRS
jgi:hypothetical protein